METERQGQPWAGAGRLLPSPLCPLSPVSDGCPWDQLFICGCARRTGEAGLLSGHGGGGRGPFGCGCRLRSKMEDHGLRDLVLGLSEPRVLGRVLTSILTSWRQVTWGCLRLAAYTTPDSSPPWSRAITVHFRQPGGLLTRNGGGNSACWASKTGEVLSQAPPPPTKAETTAPGIDNNMSARFVLSRVLHTIAPPHTSIRSQVQGLCASNATPLVRTVCVSQPVGV